MLTAPTRLEKYEDHWRYDPRFTGSFDDDPEPHRDPSGEEADRGSVRSGASMQSRRSSFSAHSQQVGALPCRDPGVLCLLVLAVGLKSDLHFWWTNAHPQPLFAVCFLRARFTEITT